MTFTAITSLRLLGGLLVVALLVMYTVRRARGMSEDPTARFSKATETGSLSFLASGTYLIGGLVVVVAMLLWPWLMESLALGVLLAGVLIAHVWWEAKERD